MTAPHTTPWIGRLSRSLSFRQARVAVIVAVILGLGFSALQIAADLRNERREVDTKFRQALGAFEESAYQAAYRLDNVLAVTVVRGLFQNSAIFEAKIIDNFGQNMAIENRPQRRGALKWLAGAIFGQAKSYSIRLQSKNRGFYAGDLSIHVDTYVIAETFLQRSGLILAFGILRNLILAIILAGLFYGMLTKPLRDVAARIKAGHSKLEVPQKHQNDELGDLVEAHNELSLQHAEAEAGFTHGQAAFPYLTVTAALPVIAGPGLT
ncbi:MAG: hypothetical protein OSB58_08130 [Alphaproteobacteria bacterium]|nr:hypothetical protein [Alphaproteobacteria bacterium]